MAESKLAKVTLEDVLSKAMVKDIWSINYLEALPFTLQDFSVGALLPAMLYMFRRGYRRGMGNFQQVFAPLAGEVTVKTANTRRPDPSVTSVSRVLVADSSFFQGFESKTGQQMLADLLLCYCLENQRHEPGRHQPLIRAFPTHYFSAWIDLPLRISNLRGVPESLVAILADQKDGEGIEPKNCQHSWFRVGSDFEHNLVLKVLGRGMQSSERSNDLFESFDENANIGIDQLLTVRTAQTCGAAPKKLSESAHRSKGSMIPNQHPVAKRAFRALSADFRILLQGYGAVTPRQCLLPMLESCIGLGLTNLMLSTASMLSVWETTGTLPNADSPWPLFVDCSSGSDRELRRLAEESMADCERRLKRVPIILMALRIIEYKASLRVGRSLPPKRPDATNRINELGEIVHGRHSQSANLLDSLADSCNAIIQQLEEATGVDDVIAVLNEDSSPNPVWRLAEAVTLMMGEKQQARELLTCLRSCLVTNESNGLGVERRVQFSTLRNGKKSGTVRSIVLTNTMLDYLVHRYLRKPGNKGQTKPHPLSFTDFLRVLRENYGVFVDQAPPGQSISVELQLRNRRILEERLRDLGLLVGVNDAESMKRLRPRFQVPEVEAANDDSN